MTFQLSFTDLVNDAFRTGKNAVIEYNGNSYNFTPQGILDFITAEGGFLTSIGTIDAVTVNWSNVPTADPAEAGAIWNENGTLKISTGV